METSSQSAVCKKPFLYSNEQSKKKHTESHLGRDHAKLGPKECQSTNRVNHHSNNNTNNNNKAAMERRESEASRRDASQCKQNKPESQPTLFPKHRLIEFMFLFMSLCLPTNLLSSHPHTDADTHVDPHTHQPSIPVDISSAPADSALSGPHSLSQSRTNEKKRRRKSVLCFDQQTAAFLSYSLSLLCSSCSHQLTLMISSHY